MWERAKELAVTIRALILIALMIVFYPIFIVVNLATAWIFSRAGHDARTSEFGVEVFSKQKGHIASYPWPEVSGLRKHWHPPTYYWEMTLTNGSVVPLHLADQAIVDAFTARGLKVDSALRMGT